MLLLVIWDGKDLRLCESVLPVGQAVQMGEHICALM